MLELVGLDSLTKEKVVGLGLAIESDVALPVSANAQSLEAKLLAEREEARAAKDFERADAIRDELAELGWEVRDSAEGAKLVRKA